MMIRYIYNCSWHWKNNITNE